MTRVRSRLRRCRMVPPDRAQLGRRKLKNRSSCSPTYRNSIRFSVYARSMLRLAQHGLMQTRLTDRCSRKSFKHCFATKAATNAAPSNRALAISFSSVTAFEQFHARTRGLPFHGLFSVCEAVKRRNSSQRRANPISQDSQGQQCPQLGENARKTPL